MLDLRRRGADVRRFVANLEEWLKTKRRHLEWIFRITTTRPALVMTGFLLAIVLSLASISTIRFDTNIFNLFPSNQPALKLLLDSLEWSGSAGESE